MAYLNHCLKLKNFSGEKRMLNIITPRNEIKGIVNLYWESLNLLNNKTHNPMMVTPAFKIPPMLIVE